MHARRGLTEAVVIAMAVSMAVVVGALVGKVVVDHIEAPHAKRFSVRVISVDLLATNRTILVGDPTGGFNYTAGTVLLVTALLSNEGTEPVVSINYSIVPVSADPSSIGWGPDYDYLNPLNTSQILPRSLQPGTASKAPFLIVSKIPASDWAGAPFVIRVEATFQDGSKAVGYVSPVQGG